jgi:hypothetical protein
MKIMVLSFFILLSCSEPNKKVIDCTCNPKINNGPHGEKFHFIHCDINKNFKQLEK